MPNVNQLKVKLFADGADLDSMLDLYKNPSIKGFTTNPTLMRKAGITDYENFARQVLQVISDRPVSFEVFADDLKEMLAQATVIASWGANVNVKIPVTNTKKEFTGSIIKKLSAAGIQLNITAVFTPMQVRRIAENLMLLVPLMLFLSIPILLKFDTLYEWTSSDFWHHHHTLEDKTAYLNKTFFFIRMIIYFVIWFLLIFGPPILLALILLCLKVRSSSPAFTNVCPSVVFQ